MSRPEKAAAGRAAQLLIAAIVVCLALLASAGSTLAAGVVPTDNGPVRGTSTAAVHEYLGIPYAAPPVGELRLRPPQAAARWRTPLDATHFAPHCPQTESPFGSPSESEDCLYLNVYAPNDGPGRGHTKNLPVMVWIHGGGFMVGESDDYDPTRLVDEGTVVVTMNYRLGALGFLAHPALTAEGGGSSSNYGLMDQQAALRWVQRNIRKFGGEPDNVTIFGQSAGGFSVLAQLASPLAGGLFDRAISQSGAYALAEPSLAQAEDQGTTFAQRVGCFDPRNVLACLRATPVSTLLANQNTPTGEITPPVDGRVLRQSLGEAISKGEVNRVPVIEGSTHDEFSIFYKLAIEDAFFGGTAPPPALYPLIVFVLTNTLQLGKDSADILQQYPISAYEDEVGLALTAIGTDALFACPSRRVVRGLSQYVPTFAYEFNDRNAPQLFVPPASIPYGAYHASELAYLFDSTTLGGHAPLTPDQEKLAAAMVSYWTQFAGPGDPNSPATPTWPAYDASTDVFQSLEPSAPHPETGFAADHKCAFWAP